MHDKMANRKGKKIFLKIKRVAKQLECKRVAKPLEIKRVAK